MQIVYTDVLVIGGGLAGQRAAIGARRRGLDVIVLSLVPAKRSHSSAAQGGMQASLGNCYGAVGDNEDIHFADTVRGSDWGADQEVVRMFTQTAPKAIRELAAWGVPWNRVARGEREIMVDGQKKTIAEPDASHGLITSRNFGGTQKWRACYVSDGTGHAMLYTMSNQAIAAGIPVHERMEALALIHADGRCHGAIVRNLMTGELLAYVARATCIATGGFGRIYRVSTNAVINEGMGAAIALEAFSPQASSLRRAAGVTAACCSTAGNTASCRTTSRKRKNWPRGTLCRAGWRSTSPPAMAPRAASASTCGWTSGCWAPTTSTTNCVK
jgi:fumarate reductase flavoprotein subunit